MTTALLILAAFLVPSLLLATACAIGGQRTQGRCDRECKRHGPATTEHDPRPPRLHVWP